MQDAGLSKSTAHRYEELAGPRDEALQAAGKAAAEHYFAQARADREPATMEGLRGAVKDAVEGTHNHRAQGTGENEWYTPAVHIEAARAVLGTIDLDPASSEIANRTVKAESIFTIEDNGLALSWWGKVWMNPPYAQPFIMQFIDKLVAEFSAGDPGGGGGGRGCKSRACYGRGQPLPASPGGGQAGRRCSSNAPAVIPCGMADFLPHLRPWAQVKTAVLLPLQRGRFEPHAV